MKYVVVNEKHRFAFYRVRTYDVYKHQGAVNHLR